MVNYTNSWNWFHWDWIQRKQEKIRGYGEATFSWIFCHLRLTYCGYLTSNSLNVRYYINFIKIMTHKAYTRMLITLSPPNEK
jgi:hypothetical protein